MPTPRKPRRTEDAFSAFRALTKRLVSVPKKELDSKAADYERKKQAKRGA